MGVVFVVCIVVPLTFEGHLDDLTNLNLEGNVPTWFSAVLMAAASLGAALCGAVTVATVDRRRERRGSRNMLTVALLALSLDEAAEIHESVVRSLRWFSWQEGFLTRAAWTGPYVLIGGALAFVLGRLLLTVHGPTRRMIVAACAVTAFGGIGIELIEAAALQIEDSPRVLRVTTNGQEVTELVGLALLLRAFIGHLEWATTPMVPVALAVRQIGESPGPSGIVVTLVQEALHEGDVEPAVELAADLVLDADEVEPAAACSAASPRPTPRSEPSPSGSRSRRRARATR